MPLSWIEFAVALSLWGSWRTSAARSLEAGRRRAIVGGGLVLLAAILAWADFHRAQAFGEGHGFRLAAGLAAKGVIAVDAVNAPLFPLIALMHWVTILATLSTKVNRFSFARTQFCGALTLATICGQGGWLLISLLLAELLPPVWELRVRGKPLRVFVIHAAILAVCLIAGWALVVAGQSWGYAFVAFGLAVRCGLPPFHCWIADYFENGSLGASMVLWVPLTGAYGVLRLLLPGTTEATLWAFGATAVAGAVYTAGMSLVQTKARRFYCFVFLSHSSMVLAGLTVSTGLSLTGGLSLWLSEILSMTGLGLTLRSLEARTGRLELKGFLGMHSQTPMLAAFFLLTGLAAVGFPGTAGFLGAEMLVEGIERVAIPLGVAIILAAALNGVSVVRAYAIIFLGARHPGTARLQCRSVERFAILILMLLIFGGAIWPQPGIQSRSVAADNLAQTRRVMRQDANPPSLGPLFKKPDDAQ